MLDTFKSRKVKNCSVAATITRQESQGPQFRSQPKGFQTAKELLYLLKTSYSLVYDTYNLLFFIISIGLFPPFVFHLTHHTAVLLGGQRATARTKEFLTVEIFWTIAQSEIQVNENSVFYFLPIWVQSLPCSVCRVMLKHLKAPYLIWRSSGNATRPREEWQRQKVKHVISRRQRTCLQCTIASGSKQPLAISTWAIHFSVNYSHIAVLKSSVP